MRLADGIRKRGFRKWYEGELTRSHLRLVLVLLCAVGAIGTLELASRQAPMAERLGSLVLLLACAFIGAVSLRRYLFLLMRAEHAASQAICPQCQTYGRLELVLGTSPCGASSCNLTTGSGVNYRITGGSLRLAE